MIGRVVGVSQDVVVSGIKLALTPGQMTDHYDMRSNTVHASEGVAIQPSVASMATLQLLHNIRVTRR